MHAKMCVAQTATLMAAHSLHGNSAESPWQVFMPAGCVVYHYQLYLLVVADRRFLQVDRIGFRRCLLQRQPGA